MGGLLILFLIGLYIWIAKKILRRVRPVWGKALVVIAALLIPTADAVYGRHKLKEMCAAEGGLRIYRVVEDVEGMDFLNSSTEKSWLETTGYKFVEGQDKGKRSRLSVLPDGMYLHEAGITPISEYVYELDVEDAKGIYSRAERRIRVRATGEILGRDVNIGYAGGWFQRFVASLYAARGNGGTCGNLTGITEFVTQTLKPIK